MTPSIEQNGDAGLDFVFDDGPWDFTVRPARTEISRDWPRPKPQALPSRPAKTPELDGIDMIIEGPGELMK